jgi:hypothetical protein
MQIVSGLPNKTRDTQQIRRESSYIAAQLSKWAPNGCQQIADWYILKQEAAKF